VEAQVQMRAGAGVVVMAARMRNEAMPCCCDARA